MNDEELIARARQLAEDGVRSAEAQALARELLRQLADRLAAPKPEARPALPPLPPHSYDPDSHIPGNSCTFCGRGQDDPLHG